MASSSHALAPLQTDGGIVVPLAPGVGRDVGYGMQNGRSVGEHAGQFLALPQLTHISALLKNVDAGDRILRGRVELFSVTNKKLSKQQQQDLRRKRPGSFEDSPLGPMSTDSAQHKMANLVALMALLFVDYDCSIASITPDFFTFCLDKTAVVSTINFHLLSLVERLHVGITSDFWKAVQEVIDIVNCDVYAYEPPAGTFEPVDKSLSAFHYFFLDLTRGRILFIGVATYSKGARGGVDSDSDMHLSQDGCSSVGSKGTGSSEGSALADGDFQFGSDASGDENMID